MRLQLCVTAVTCFAACGTMPMADAGVDAGRRDSGVVAPIDAGYDAGAVEVDAGPPPPPIVTGTMTVNGVVHELKSGFLATAATNVQFRLSTDDQVLPRLTVAMIISSDAGAGFSAPCSATTDPVVVFFAQHISDAGTAFYTRNPTCMVAISQVATMLDEEYVGTFSGSVNVNPNSGWDAGYGTFTVTSGSFTVKRTF